MKRIAHLLGTWLWIGFSGGALVLLFIATPIESFFKSRGMPQVRIDLILSGIALGWVVVSFLAARAAARRLSSPRKRVVAHVAGALICAVVFTVFLQAGAGGFGFARAEELKEGRFTFGPYPDEKTMARLKQDGVVGVVSLMSSLIPFEAILLEKERKAAAAAGLQMVEAPMLPWVSSNRASLDILAQLASSGHARYYVHCYLGRHRVELARITLRDAQGIGAQPANADFPGEFELGPVTVIGDSVIVGPMPSPEEFFTLRTAGVRHIVSLLDPQTDSIRINVDKAAARDLNMELHFLSANDPADLTATVKAIQSFQGRVYVHGYLVDDRTRSVMAALER